MWGPSRRGVAIRETPDRPRSPLPRGGGGGTSPDGHRWVVARSPASLSFGYRYTVPALTVRQNDGPNPKLFSSILLYLLVDLTAATRDMYRRVRQRDWVRRSPNATLSSTAVNPHGRATFRAQRPRGLNLRDPTSVLCQFHCPSSGADSRAQSGSSTLTSSPKRCLIALSKPPLLGVGHEPLGSL